MWQHRWALLSGFLGASASCLIKMAVTFDDSNNINDNDSSSNNMSPLLYLSEKYCQPSWVVDFDTVVLKRIHWVLGTLMVRYRINFTRSFKAFQDTLLDVLIELRVFEIDYCHFGLIFPRLLCLILMLLLNAYMIACFLKGLKVSGSVVGTALSSAANFAASAVYGAVIWNERFQPTWWVGFSCVMMGVLLLSSVQAVSSSSSPSPPPNPPTTTIASKQSQRRFNHSSLSKPTVTATPPPPTSITAYGKKKFEPKTAKHTNDNQSSYDNKPKPTPKVYRSTIRPVFKPTNEPKKDVSESSRQFRESVKSKYTNPKTTKAIEPPPSLIDKRNALKSSLVDRSFANECPLCEGEFFDEVTGESPNAIADLSPNCFHVFHSKCLKSISPKRFQGKSKCPICDKSISMWSSARQAAHFGGFWLERVESILKELGPVVDDKGISQPRSASEIRQLLQDDPTLSDAQKQYIDDDPSGLGKGLFSALEWGGCIDCNDCSKGNVGWSQCLRTMGIWKFDSKKDDIWLWEWGNAHPRQRCEQCQLMKRPLSIVCLGCEGSSEAALYCSESCQKRDWLRHKMNCLLWQSRSEEEDSVK